MLKKIRDYLAKPSAIEGQEVQEPIDEDFVAIQNSDLRLNTFQRDTIQTIFLNIVFRLVLNDVFIILKARIKECKEAVDLDEEDFQLKCSQRDDIEYLVGVEKLKFQNTARQSFEGELKKSLKYIISKNYLHSSHVEDLKEFYTENQAKILPKLNQHLLAIRKKLLDKITKDLSDNSDFNGGNVTAMTEQFIDGFDDIKLVDGKSVDGEATDKTKDAGSVKKKIKF